MTRQLEFDKNANAFADRYSSFLSNLKSAFQSRILNRNITYKSIKSFEKEAYALASVYLENEVEQVQRAEEAIKQYIESDFAKYSLEPAVLKSPDYMAYLDDYTKFVYESIKQQVSKDILSATQRLRVESLKLLNNNYDYVGLFLKYKEPEFFYNDKLGRNLPSKKYIRTLIRDYFVKAYNDIFIENLALHNIDKVAVDHIDLRHKHYGLVLSVNDDENELNYFKVREDIFHPNSNAVLVLAD